MTVTLIIIGITWAVRSAASLWCMVAFMSELRSRWERPIHR